MTKFILFISFIVSFNCVIKSQINPGAKQISLANSSTALCNDVFALFNNPAGIAQMNWREVGIYYSPAPFGLKELANGYVAYNEPFSFGSIAIGGMSYGFELYKETKLLLGFAYNYQNKFFAGTALTFHNFSIKNYGSKGVFYFNLGGLAYLNKTLRWGFAVSNLNRATVGNEDDQIPMVFDSGFSFDILNELTLNGSIEKDIRYNTSFMFGIDYDIIKYFSVRIGFANEPSKYSAGIGINYSLFSLDYAIFTHPDLGLTHQAGIIIHFFDNVTRKEKIRSSLGLN